MKRKINQYIQQNENGTSNRRRILMDFTKLLDDQVERVILFLLEQQGLLARRLANLLDHDNFPDRQDLDYAHICELKEVYRAVGRDLLDLLFFVEMNTTGLRKILKKFDKRLGYGLTDHYLKTRVNHPYSQLQQLFKHVGLTAITGAISRNLDDLQGTHGSPSTSSQPQDSIIDSIQEAIDRATISSHYLHKLTLSVLVAQEEFTPPTESEEVSDNKQYHLTSLVLNILGEFLYVVNTYVILPTANDYSKKLGKSSTACGVVIGAMALGEVFSCTYLSAWSKKCYAGPLLFSSILLIVGNSLYGLAYHFNSFWVLLIGRLACGLGSARMVYRCYVNDCAPPRIRVKALSSFVASSAIGMTCGPAFAGLLQMDFNILGFAYNKENLPGWSMAVLWLLYLFMLCVLFKEPSYHTKIETYADENSTIQHSLLNSRAGEEGENKFCTERPSSFVSALKSLNNSVKVQLFSYFMLKYTMEILVGESAVVTSYYFDWSTTQVSVFLACLLGLTVLPVKTIGGSYIINAFEVKKIVLVSHIIVFIGILLSLKVPLISFSVVQYVCSGSILLLSAQILEGLTLTLLSRELSSHFSHGTYSGGWLTTEAGTISRVIADTSITVLGLLGEGELLNLSVTAPLAMCAGSIIATFCYYSSW